VRQVTDARGASVGLPDRVERVVSLVPSLTEWLVVAGVGERLSGSPTGAWRRPTPWPGCPGCWAPRTPDLAAIRELEPNLVLANAEENRKLDVQRLEAGGLAVFVTMPTTVAGAVAELPEEVAAAFGGHRVELVDGRALTWYGPRIPAALAGFRELLGGAA
jgi:ABC-type Fe3+-hydroxamate transport system substrate-binding protein